MQNFVLKKRLLLNDIERLNAEIVKNNHFIELFNLQNTELQTQIKTRQAEIENLNNTIKTTQMSQPKYSVENPSKLKSWEAVARTEITRWLTDDSYQATITKTTMAGESMGPFTKFLYYFSGLCECGWGVMVDFNERKQRVFLPDHYYKWMHKLRDEIELDIEQKAELNQNQLKVNL